MIDNKRIKKLIDFLGMNPSQFAKSVGMDRSRMHKFLSGTGNITISADALGEILRLYKVHPNWLFFGEGGDDPVFIDGFVPKKKLEEKEAENIELLKENRELYRRLSELQKLQNERLKHNTDISDNE